jgi:hypothetical protein
MAICAPPSAVDYKVIVCPHISQMFSATFAPKLGNDFATAIVDDPSEPITPALDRRDSLRSPFSR